MSKITATEPKPYTIDIPSSEWERARKIAELTDLTKWAEKLVPEADEGRPDYDFANDYGIKSSRVINLVERLKNGFDWPKWEKVMRDMGEHYTTLVKGIEDEPEGLQVHFVVKQSEKKDAPWLLLVHGWPGSFLEFYKMAPMLSPHYNIVMPSIPGYTFSSAPKSGPTFGLIKAAQSMDAVMQSLRIDKYFAQGGDWGSAICRHLAVLVPERCAAIHVNLESGSLDRPNPADQPAAKQYKEFKERGTAYQQMHLSVPYTIGAMLASSPVVCLAYIGEKFYRWSAETSHPTEDEIIASSLLYWFTGSTTSAVWLYYTTMGKGSGLAKVKPSLHPTAYGGGPSDIVYPTEEDFRKDYSNAISYNLAPKGGHFLAMEQPEWLARDVHAAFSKVSNKNATKL